MSERLHRVLFAGAAFMAGCTAVERSGNDSLQPLETAAPIETPAPVTSTETTTETVPQPYMEGAANPDCVLEIRTGDTLTYFAQLAFTSVAELQTENRIENPDYIQPGPLDICINEVNDFTGEARPPVTTVPPTTLGPVAPATAVPGIELPSGVTAQQQKANDLLAGYGMPPLAVDGDPGPQTDQQICALRALLNLPVSRADMIPGSEEERVLMSAESISLPSDAARSAARWILIDKTCQVTILGEGNERIVQVFPSSTGAPGFETRNGENEAFRFDPALANNGWRNSSEYPADVTSLLNGNMYKPLYFDEGQAIHGSMNVPTAPGSKGCNRLSPAHQDILVNWLGIQDVAEETWDIDRIGVTVTVRGEYIPG